MSKLASALELRENRRVARTWVVVLLLATSGCTLEVKKLFDLDGSVELGLADRGPPETRADTAPLADVTLDVAADVPLPDAPAFDAPLPLDAAVDTVAPPDKSCPPESCNGIDDDCDGTVDNGACETGCTGEHKGGSDFAFCSGALSWSDAKASCAKMSMELAWVLDDAENSWILSTALSLSFSTNAWLGGSDAATEGIWLWPDGTAFWSGPDAGVGYASWGQGEPNNSGGSEACLELIIYPFNLLLAGDWNDEGCGSLNAYVCRK